INSFVGTQYPPFPHLPPHRAQLMTRIILQPNNSTADYMSSILAPSPPQTPSNALFLKTDPKAQSQNISSMSMTMQSSAAEAIQQHQYQHQQHYQQHGYGQEPHHAHAHHANQYHHYGYQHHGQVPQQQVQVHQLYHNQNPHQLHGNASPHTSSTLTPTQSPPQDSKTAGPHHLSLGIQPPQPAVNYKNVVPDSALAPGIAEAAEPAVAIGSVGRFDESSIPVPVVLVAVEGLSSSNETLNETLLETADDKEGKVADSSVNDAIATISDQIQGLPMHDGDVSGGDFCVTADTTTTAVNVNTEGELLDERFENFLSLSDEACLDGRITTKEGHKQRSEPLPVAKSEQFSLQDHEQFLTGNLQQSPDTSISSVYSANQSNIFRPKGHPFNMIAGSDADPWSTCNFIQDRVDLSGSGNRETLSPTAADANSNSELMNGFGFAQKQSQLLDLESGLRFGESSDMLDSRRWNEDTFGGEQVENLLGSRNEPHHSREPAARHHITNEIQTLQSDRNAATKRLQKQDQEIAVLRERLLAMQSFIMDKYFSSSGQGGRGQLQLPNQDISIQGLVQSPPQGVMNTSSSLSTDEHNAWNPPSWLLENDNEQRLPSSSFSGKRLLGGQSAVLLPKRDDFGRSDSLSDGYSHGLMQNKMQHSASIASDDKYCDYASLQNEMRAHWLNASNEMGAIDEQSPESYMISEKGSRGDEQQDQRFRSSQSSLTNLIGSEANSMSQYQALVDKIVRSNDQPASLILQQKLKITSDENRETLIEVIKAQALPLIKNRFGNFLVQRCLEVGEKSQVRSLASTIFGNAIFLSCDRFGCHVVQKALELCDDDIKLNIIAELILAVPETITHRFACHVWQRVFESKWPTFNHQNLMNPTTHATAVSMLSLLDPSFNVASYQQNGDEQYYQHHLPRLPNPVYVILKRVNAVLRRQWHIVANDESGSLVVQCIFENCNDGEKRSIVQEVLEHAADIARGQWGNWVIQHLLDRGDASDKTHILQVVAKNVHSMSMDQFASKVVEKALKICQKKDLYAIVDCVLAASPGPSGENRSPPLIEMMNNQYANYVVQHMLTLADPHQRDTCARMIAPHLSLLRGSKYGQRVASLVEKHLRSARDRFGSFLNLNGGGHGGMSGMGNGGFGGFSRHGHDLAGGNVGHGSIAGRRMMMGHGGHASNNPGMSSSGVFLVDASLQGHGMRPAGGNRHMSGDVGSYQAGSWPAFGLGN
ncbi:hypothetical protein HDU76_002112, partial [Blyttiomyces sp. JEL0837]